MLGGKGKDMELDNYSSLFPAYLQLMSVGIDCYDFAIIVPGNWH